MKVFVVWAAIMLVGGMVGWPIQGGGGRLSRQKVEALLGEKCSAIVPSEGWTCYETGGSLKTLVQYDGEDYVRVLSLFGCSEPLEELDKVAAKIVPESSRGEYLGRKAEKPGPECFQSYSREYEHIKMQYTWADCYGCTHPSLQITWKP